MMPQAATVLHDSGVETQSGRELDGHVQCWDLGARQHSLIGDPDFLRGLIEPKPETEMSALL